jgi:hypothetical protein
MFQGVRNLAKKIDDEKRKENILREIDDIFDEAKKAVSVKLADPHYTGSMALRTFIDVSNLQLHWGEEERRKRYTKIGSKMNVIYNRIWKP